MNSPVIDPATVTWDGANQCWTWSSPSGLRHYRGDFSVEYSRPVAPRKSKPTRRAVAPTSTGLWLVEASALVPALRTAGAVVAARLEELERARRAIQVRREAEQLEGVVTVTECAKCGAPPPARGQPCRHCGTIAPG